MKKDMYVEPAQKAQSSDDTPFVTSPIKSSPMPSGLARTAAIANIVTMFIAVCVFLYLTRIVLVPFAIAIILTYASRPVLRFLRGRLHLPRMMAASLTFLLTVCLTFLIIWYPVFFLGDSLIRDLEAYRARINEVLLSTVHWLQTRDVPVSLDDVVRMFSGLPFSDYAQNFAGEAASFFTTTMMVLIFYLFMITGSGVEIPKIGVIEEIDRRIGKYLWMKLLVSAAVGALVGLSLALFGVELALLIGFITFVFNFIPNIGSIFSTIILIPIALFYAGDWTRFFGVILVPSLIHFIIGNIVEPKVQGDVLDMHPVAVLVALLFWGLIWGVAGLFLSVPLTAIIQILAARYESTAWIADMIAGKWQPRQIYRTQFFE